jgi:hypothetical protein
MVEGDLWANSDWIIPHWGEVTPVFVKSYDVLWKWGFDEDAKEFSPSALVKNKEIIEMLGRAGDEIVCYMLRKSVVKFTAEKGVETGRLMDPWEGVLLIFDWGFYKVAYNKHLDSNLKRFIEMVKSDQALREGWLRWFDGEKERLKNWRSCES